MDFTSKIIVERTNVAQRASVKEQGEFKPVLQINISVKTLHFIQRIAIYNVRHCHIFVSWFSQMYCRRTWLCHVPLCLCAEYMCHVYVRSDSLAGVLVSDHEYPPRVSFTLMNKVWHHFGDLAWNDNESLPISICTSTYTPYIACILYKRLRRVRWRSISVLVINVRVAVVCSSYIYRSCIIGRIYRC